MVAHASGHESEILGSTAVINPMFLLHSRPCASTQIQRQIRGLLPKLLPKSGFGHFRVHPLIKARLSLPNYTECDHPDVARWLISSMILNISRELRDPHSIHHARLLVFVLNMRIVSDDRCKAPINHYSSEHFDARNQNRRRFGLCVRLVGTYLNIGKPENKLDRF